MPENILESELSPEDFRQHYAGQRPEQVEPELKALLNQRLNQTQSHGSWADLAEELGCPSLALREAQLALRDQPGDPEALKRLGMMLFERGQILRAASHLQAALEQHPDDLEIRQLLEELQVPSAVAEQDFTEEASGKISADSQTASEPELPLEASAIRFLHCFGGREDVYARQWASRDGRSGYTPVQQALTPRLIQGHLAGNETLGVYCLRLDGTVNFLALDLDINKQNLQQALVNPLLAQEVRQQLSDNTRLIYEQLQLLGLTALIENSGHKGRHFWLLLSRPVQAEVAHLLGNLLLRKLQPLLPASLHLESFPKQPSLETHKNLGNLIKLPLGKHQKSGRRSLFLTPAGEVVKSWDRYLSEFPRNQPDQLYYAIDELKRAALPEITEADTRPVDTNLPAPELVQRVWTEADFGADQQIQHVLKHCPVLARLKHQAEFARQLSNQEQLVLIHTLGGLTNGVLAVNYLFSRCVNIAPERYLKSRLQGNPTSCPKIRRRLPHITAQVACHCLFENEPDHYPTPSLHLRTLPTGLKPEPVKPNLESQARRYAALERRMKELQTEHQLLGQELAEQIAQLPDARLLLSDGQYVLRQDQELQVLEWEPVHEP